MRVVVGGLRCALMIVLSKKKAITLVVGDGPRESRSVPWLHHPLKSLVVTASLTASGSPSSKVMVVGSDVHAYEFRVRPVGQLERPVCVTTRDIRP